MSVTALELTTGYLTPDLCRAKKALLGQKKLIICFSGTARVTFNPPAQKIFIISSIHIEKMSIHRELSV